MKHSALAAGLTALMVFTLVGCKSGPRTAWWKSSKAAESTAVAHSAPALPSDIAKKAEKHPPNAAQVAGGVAAPFKPAPSAATVAAASPADYPQTGAPAFSPATAAQSASAAPNASTGLGSIAMPYDPSKAPQAKSTVAAAPTPTPTDRYGAALANVAPAFDPASGANAPAANLAALGAQQAGQAINAAVSAADQYASSTAEAAQKAVADATQQAGESYAAAQQAAAAGSATLDRYGLPITTTTPSLNPAAAAAPQAVQVASTSQPYRPGGTGTYPTTGSQLAPSAVQVASRPQPTAGSTVPNVAVPSATTTPTAPPSRY